MAEDWERAGVVTPVTGKKAPKFRWGNLGELWACWSRSASARMVARLDPRRMSRRRGVASAPAVSAGGCGCHGGSQEMLHSIDAGISLTGGPVPSSGTREDPVRTEVRQYYDERAKGVRGGGASCCGGEGLPAEVSAVTKYAEHDLRQLPVDAITASLGCGNPFERAGLTPGEVVLDLGSGGGLDAIVAARRVGSDGHVFGLDMSDEMISLAQANTSRAGVTNVAFLKGDMESIPLPPASVDVIISNCVVNLVPDKGRALTEAYRVLRPGGRLAISDIVTREPVPTEMKADLAAWAACIGGALTADEYREHLLAAGFVDVEIVREREYTARDAELGGVAPVLERLGLAEALSLGFANTSVRATKATATGRNVLELVPTSARVSG
jgi:SAM-dependent methyltransferase